jgi:predicted nucleic acid-binding protein
MRKVIVNSTPIIALSKAGRLHLLKELYGQISIPTAVKEEVTRKNDSVKAELESCDWIHVEPITDSTSKSIGKGDKQCQHWI